MSRCETPRPADVLVSESATCSIDWAKKRGRPATDDRPLTHTRRANGRKG